MGFLGRDLLQAEVYRKDSLDIRQSYADGQLWSSSSRGFSGGALTPQITSSRYEADPIEGGGSGYAAEPIASTDTSGSGHILDANTLFLWRLDETHALLKSVIKDYGTLALDATAATTAKTADTLLEGPPDANGNPTYCRKFRSGDNTTHVAASNATLLAAVKTLCTFEFLVKMPDWGPPGNTFSSHTLFTFGAAAGNTTARVDLRAGTSGTSVGTLSYVYNTAAGQQIVSQSVGKRVFPGVWSHCALVLQASTLEFYIDGVLSESVALGAKTDKATAAVSLGSNINTNLWSDCYMKCLKLTSRAKTASEIAQANEYFKTNGTLPVEGDNLVFWKMDETGGLCLDRGPYKTNLLAGEPTNSISSTPLVKEGYSRVLNSTHLAANFTKSATRDARGYGVERLRQVLVDTTGWTFECWYNLAEPIDANRGLFCYGDPGNTLASHNFFTIDVLTDRKIQVFSEYGVDLNSIITTTQSVPLGTHHLALRRNPTSGVSHTMDIFVDGVLLETLLGIHQFEAGDDENQPLVIGYGATETAAPFRGILDDVRFSMIPRSDAEIQESYSRGIGLTFANGYAVGSQGASMIEVTQNVSKTVSQRFFGSTTGSPLTITGGHISGAVVQLKKSGGAFATITPTLTARGTYIDIDLTNTHLDTLGIADLTIDVSGALPATIQLHVIAMNKADAVRAGLTALPNANAAAANGLPTIGTSTGQINLSGGKADAQVKGMDADTLTDTVLAASAVTEIQTGLAVTTDVTNIRNDIADVKSDTSLLPAATPKIDVLYQIGVGRWKIQGTQLLIYDSDNTTLLFAFNLKDDTGSPSATKIFERVPT